MKKSIHIILNCTLGMSMLFVSACSTTNAPATVKQAGSITTEPVVSIKQGKVISVKEVAIMGSKGRTVGTVGSIAGSILGSTIPVAGSIIGSMIGSAVGSEADKEFSKQKGLEITLELDSGVKVVVTQLAQTQFKAGDEVQLIMTDEKARVAHLQSNS